MTFGTRQVRLKKDDRATRGIARLFCLSRQLGNRYLLQCGIEALRAHLIGKQGKNKQGNNYPW